LGKTRILYVDCKEKGKKTRRDSLRIAMVGEEEENYVNG